MLRSWNVIYLYGMHKCICNNKYNSGKIGFRNSDIEEKGKSKVFEDFEIELEIREKLKNYVYVIESDRFINYRTGLELTSQVHINSFLATIISSPINFIQLLRKNLVKTVHKMDFLPSSKRTFFKRNKLSYYNRFSGVKEIDEINNKNAGGNNQKLILFKRGNAISGAPIIKGTNQLPKPPIIAGITMKKIIIKA